MVEGSGATTPITYKTIPYYYDANKKPFSRAEHGLFLLRNNHVVCISTEFLLKIFGHCFFVVCCIFFLFINFVIKLFNHNVFVLITYFYLNMLGMTEKLPFANMDRLFAILKFCRFSASSSLD